MDFNFNVNFLLMNPAVTSASLRDRYGAGMQLDDSDRGIPTGIGAPNDDYLHFFESSPRDGMDLTKNFGQMTEKICLVRTNLGENWSKVRVARGTRGLRGLITGGGAKLNMFCKVVSTRHFNFKKGFTPPTKSTMSPCPPEKFHNRFFEGKRGENEQKVRIVRGTRGLRGHRYKGVIRILAFFGVIANKLVRGLLPVNVPQCPPMSPNVPLKNFTIEYSFYLLVVSRLLSAGGRDVAWISDRVSMDPACDGLLHRERNGLTWKY
jgi:hypothetical protein